MFTFSPTTTPHHSRCHYFSCAVFFFVHQFNAVYESHSFVLYGVSNTSTHNTNKRTDINTYAHIHIHSLTRSFTHTRSFARTHTLSRTLARSGSRSAALCLAHSDVCARSLRLSLARFLLHTRIGYTYALHINRLLLILFIIFYI